ncbi:MAG: GntR family transcriptional regulator [Chloroflexi bacterium]|nr:GntR family transcriptional regulator [Chloroflexota bacterium]MCH8875432.1 GntR family transcriptional regulator [Chloroflexota bacterium]MCI0773425.1 GntR family transcriptional regulator [Chloroflexota bacterium]MCI0862094.1 GntR family transcriptional regulator [Chloroflexota bacterium]
MVELNFRGGETIYSQIVDQIQKRIDAGELKPGDQLPTVRELADELEVNFNTVARAYRKLDASGSISTQQGRGTYVIEPDDSNRTTLEEIARRFAGQAHRLGFEPEEVAKAVGFVLGQWELEGRPPDE